MYYQQGPTYQQQPPPEHNPSYTQNNPPYNPGTTYAPQYNPSTNPQYPPQYSNAPNPQYNPPPQQYPPPQQFPPPERYQQEHPSTPINRGHEQKFPETPQYRDLFWAVLFILHLVGFIILCVAGSVKYGKGASNELYVNVASSDFRDAVKVVAICIAAAVLMSFAWLSIMRRYARGLIIGTFVATVILWAAFGIILLANGSVVGGIIMLLLAALFAFFFYAWRSRIPFATAMLQTVSRLSNDYPGTSYLAYLSIVVHVLYNILFIWTITVSQYLTQNAGFLLIFYLFSYYWVTQVIKNVVHVSVSGTFATWYFLQGTMPSNPTVKSFQRATTTSFGSISLGSLLVAALETFRALIRIARTRNDNFIAFCADCILGCIDNLLQYFNLYAFTQVAIYGKTYVQSAKDTWALLHSHGVEAIINDNLISNVLSFGALVGGVVCAIIGALVGLVVANNMWVTCTAIGFVIGYMMLIVVMEVVQSGVATLFVCFAMDREALRRNDPYLFDKFMVTYYN